MNGLKQSAGLVGALFGALAVAGCYVAPLQPNPFATNKTHGVDYTEVPEAEAEAPDGFFGGDGLFGGGGMFGP